MKVYFFNRLIRVVGKNYFLGGCDLVVPRIEHSGDIIAGQFRGRQPLGRKQQEQQKQNPGPDLGLAGFMPLHFNEGHSLSRKGL